MPLLAIRRIDHRLVRGNNIFLSLTRTPTRLRGKMLAQWGCGCGRVDLICSKKDPVYAGRSCGMGRLEIDTTAADGGPLLGAKDKEKQAIKCQST